MFNSKKSNFIYKFLFVIIFCNSTQQQQQTEIPPIACPNYFQYLHDGSQYLGRISLPNVGNNVNLVVHFSLRTPLQTNYPGKLIKEENAPSQYRVEFPSPNEIPKLTKITVNGQDICASDDYPTGSKFFLNHILRTTTRIQAFNQPQTSFRPETFNQPQTPFRPETFNQPQTSFRPETLIQLFQQTEPVANDVGGFLAFSSTSPNILPRPIQTQTLQQVPKPLQQVTPSPKNTIQDNFSLQPTFKIGQSAVGNQAAPQIGQCGEETRVGGFVFGGEELSRGQFPWLTAIYNKQSGLRFLCGGSLVSPRTVVTAGHCFKVNHLKADRLVVELGRHNLEDYSEKDYVTREIEKLIIHPDYNSNVFPDADLAILHLESSVQYTTYIRPICLWTESSDVNRLVGQSGVIAGWGADETGRSTTALPKKINTNIVSNAECLNSSQTYSSLTTGRTFCAGNRDGTGPCIGDSGSGLMIYQNDRWFIRGVVSAGQMKQHTCDLQEFVVFCDVAKHWQWIQSQTVS